MSSVIQFKNHVAQPHEKVKAKAQPHCKPINSNPCKYLSGGLSASCEKQGKCEGWK